MSAQMCVCLCCATCHSVRLLERLVYHVCVWCRLSVELCVWCVSLGDEMCGICVVYMLYVFVRGSSNSCAGVVCLNVLSLYALCVVMCLLWFVCGVRILWCMRCSMSICAVIVCGMYGEDVGGGAVLCCFCVGYKWCEVYDIEVQNIKLINQ